jgi:hypothetical protein
MMGFFRLAIGHLRVISVSDWNLDFDSSRIESLLRKHRGVCQIEPILVTGTAERAVGEADQTAGRNDGREGLLKPSRTEATNTWALLAPAVFRLKYSSINGKEQTEPRLLPINACCLPDWFLFAPEAQTSMASAAAISAMTIIVIYLP